MKKILISGDSFAADWNKKFKNKTGWVNMLETDFDVTNVAEAGVSEYKIYKQLQKIEIKNFDYVIVSHTSANRIPIDEHPIHKEDILHNNCDLIFSDVNEHIDNPIMKIAYDFYTNIFYPEYFCFINELIYREIHKITPNAIHMTFFDNFYDDDILKFENIFKKNKGNVNHLNHKGNQIIYSKIKKIINNIL
jgi:hypothetical protein